MNNNKLKNLIVTKNSLLRINSEITILNENELRSCLGGWGIGEFSNETCGSHCGYYSCPSNACGTKVPGCEMNCSTYSCSSKNCSVNE